MKKINALVIALLAVFMLASCGSKQEETKMISSNEIKMSGKHKNMVTIASDSIKIMLVCVDEEDNKWDVRAILPIGNTKIWSEIPSKELKGDDFEYEPRFGNFTVSYLDANGSELDHDISPDYSVLESILSSDALTIEDVLVKDRWENLGDKSYKAMKAIYDKVANISLTQIELSKVYKVKESSSSSSKKSSSYDYDSDDFDKAVEQAEKALETYEKTLDALEKIDDLDW